MQKKIYLPGDKRTRMQDLMKDRKTTQAEVSAAIGISESAFSRYLQGKTEMLGDDYVVRMARFFDVSTDFLLGETQIPDRKNVQIEDLGLSAESVKYLLTRPQIAVLISWMLINEHFQTVLQLLKRYQDQTIRIGYAAQKQQFELIQRLLMTHSENCDADKDPAALAAKSIRLVKQPDIRTEEEVIEREFKRMIADYRRFTEESDDSSAVLKANAEILEKFKNELSQGQELDLNAITPEKIVGAVVQTAGLTDLPEDIKKNLENGMLGLFKGNTERNDN